MRQTIRTITAICLTVFVATSCAQNDANETNSVSEVENKDKSVVLEESSGDVVEQHYGKKDGLKIPKAASLADIQKLIGTSCQSNAQCKVLGVGHRACGGHASFLIYSSVDTDEKQLKSQVAIYNGMQKLNNAKKGMVGICQHLEPPKAYCSVNQCVATVNGRAVEIK